MSCPAARQTFGLTGCMIFKEIFEGKVLVNSLNYRRKKALYANSLNVQIEILHVMTQMLFYEYAQYRL
jgi:hypothetical protein